MKPRDDFRATMGEGPGLHALICGVSYYHHLPGGDGKLAAQTFEIKKPLIGPATTAAAIYEWLKTVAGALRVPLATTRLLLSPAKAEAATLDAYHAPRCTWENFDQAAKKWQQDSRSHPNNYSLFYFAGHGVQRSGTDVVMLMENYGDGQGATLSKGVPVLNLTEGMAPGANPPESTVARTQFYFIDCCRVAPDIFQAHELKAVGEVLVPVASPGDDRCYPIFFAAIPGATAVSLQNQLTVFGEAILECLKGGAATARDSGGGVEWWVTSHSISAVLESKLDQLNDKYQVGQRWQPGGAFQPAPLVRAPGPPQTSVELNLDPLQAHPYTQLKVTDSRGSPIWDIPKPVFPHPYAKPLTAGMYYITARIDPPTSGYVDCLDRGYLAEWPGKKWNVKVTP